MATFSRTTSRCMTPLASPAGIAGIEIRVAGAHIGVRRIQRLAVDLEQRGQRHTVTPPCCSWLRRVHRTAARPTISSVSWMPSTAVSRFCSRAASVSKPAIWPPGHPSSPLPPPAGWWPGAPPRWCRCAGRPAAPRKARLGGMDRAGGQGRHRHRPGVGPAGVRRCGR